MRSGSGFPMASSDDAARNRDLWTRRNAEYTGPRARDKWAAEEISWGIWGTPERDLGALGELAGLDVVELGCGTAYFSAWLARRGARPVGVDITPAQLETARGLMEELGIEFPLIEADGGDTGLPASSFDLVLSEYGASIWVDPYRFVPEAARLLRPGGRLVFMCTAALVALCGQRDGRVTEQLQVPQFGLHRFEPDDGGDGVEFALAHGDWIRLLRANGFEVENLIEIQAPPDAEDHSHYDYVSAEWAKKWPSEELWVAHKR